MRVNRPEALNALSTPLLMEMLEHLNALVLEQKTKALILTGEGEKAFIAGADIAQMQSMDFHAMLEFCRLGQAVANALENASFATIAAVNGYALGGGLEMALACDFIYASRTASMGLPEITLGLIPGFGGTQRLSRAIGIRLAKELIMSGKTITAEEASAIGLVNRVCDPETLMEACLLTAANISQYPAMALKLTKKAINQSLHLDLNAALVVERNLCASCLVTPESRAMVTAFLTKHTNRKKHA